MGDIIKFPGPNATRSALKKRLENELEKSNQAFSILFFSKTEVLNALPDEYVKDLFVDLLKPDQTVKEICELDGVPYDSSQSISNYIASLM